MFAQKGTKNMKLYQKIQLQLIEIFCKCRSIANVSSQNFVNSHFWTFESMNFCGLDKTTDFIFLTRKETISR